MFQYLNNDLSLEKTASVMNDSYLYLYDFLKPYLKNLKGDNFEKLRQLVQKNKMIDFFLLKLKKGNREEKIKAAAFLGKVREKRALPLLKEYLNSEDKSLMTASIWAIADIGEQELFFPVLKTVLNENSFTFEALTEILIRFGEESCYQIKEFLEINYRAENNLTEILEVPEYQSLSLFFDIFGYFRFIPGVEVMVPTLEADFNEEVLIHIFKALVKIEYPIDKDLSPFLNHKSWVVRSQAARYLAEIKESNYLSDLKKLLSDQNWWVRYYSALAIFELGKKDLLIEIIKNKEPGYEMGRYILDQAGDLKVGEADSG
ncbi:HEAT repeat domain-containing protein [Halanaerobium saccharolyticum]|uniref:HEAT repeat domain-containing protein n=1 Tax=Halanaerobium saccharolyticum TaxID=43595 RepID=UPI001414EC2C|nr:HEAT repeat domain-containing protein [Halanaerobium saccharolyticum]